MPFTRLQRILRRVPALRWCALQHARQARKRRSDVAWEATQTVLVAMGNISISWAGISLILNRFFEAYFEQIGPIGDRGLPRHFSTKLKYMQKVEGLANWDPARLAEFTALRLELTELNSRRVEIVHGLAMRQGYGPAWTIHVAKEMGDRLDRRNVTKTDDDILRLAAEMSDVGRRLSAFFMPMFDTPAKPLSRAL